MIARRFVPLRHCLQLFFVKFPTLSHGTGLLPFVYLFKVEREEEVEVAREVKEVEAVALQVQGDKEEGAARPPGSRRRG